VLEINGKAKESISSRRNENYSAVECSAPKEEFALQQYLDEGKENVPFPKITSQMSSSCGKVAW
jgi:hypothetical protein